LGVADQHVVHEDRGITGDTEAPGQIRLSVVDLDEARLTPNSPTTLCASRPAGSERFQV
jgi:hypothetical protein